MIDQKTITRHKAIQADRKAKAKASLPLSNRKLADRLSDARRAVYDAEAVYDALRDMVLEAGGAIGDEFVASVSSQTTTRVDRKMLEQRFGKQAVAECCKQSTSARVMIRAKAGSVFD